MGNLINIKKGYLMKIKKTYTVTVGIPVHNEAENISYLLQSILDQKQESYLLEKIIVSCDGCTDNTLEIVKNLATKYPIISLKVHQKRQGKTKRLLELYHLNQSDFIVTFDGDVVLGDSEVIEKIISHLKSKQIAIVGANALPIKATTLIENLINDWKRLWYEVRKDVKGGNHVHNIKGCGLALKKEFAKTIQFPEGVVSDAKILYFEALRQNLKFHHTKDAVVFYRSPDNLHDYFLQYKNRGEPDRDKIAQIYGSRVYKEYQIPLKFKIRGVLKMFFISPLSSFLATIFYLLTRFYPHDDFDKPGFWKMAQSSKKGININLN